MTKKWTTSFLETALANRSSILQIFLQSKSGINQTTDSKVRAKKLTFCWLKVNFLAITIESVVWLIPDFDCRKICRIDDLFAKAVSRNEVVHLSEKGATWMRISCSTFWNMHCDCVVIGRLDDADDQQQELNYNLNQEQKHRWRSLEPWQEHYMEYDTFNYYINLLSWF